MLDTQSRYPLFPLLIFTLASWMAVLASGVSGCLDLVTKWCTMHGCASWSACSGAAVALLLPSVLTTRIASLIFLSSIFSASILQYLQATDAITYSGLHTSCKS